MFPLNLGKFSFGNFKFPDPYPDPEKFDNGDCPKARPTFWPVGVAGSCLLGIGGVMGRLRMVGGVVGSCLLIRAVVLNSSGLRNP